MSQIKVFKGTLPGNESSIELTVVIVDDTCSIFTNKKFSIAEDRAAAGIIGTTSQVDIVFKKGMDLSNVSEADIEAILQTIKKQKVELPEEDPNNDPE